MPRESIFYFFIFLSLVIHACVYIFSPINLSSNRVEQRKPYNTTLAITLSPQVPPSMKMSNANTRKTDKKIATKVSPKANKKIINDIQKNQFIPKKKSIKERPKNSKELKNSDKKKITTQSSTKKSSIQNIHKNTKTKSKTIDLHKSIQELDINSLVDQQEKIRATDEAVVFNPSLRKKLQSIKKEKSLEIQAKEDYTFNDQHGNTIHVQGDMCYKTSQTEEGNTRWALPSRCSWSETTSEKMLRNMQERLKSQ